MDAPLRVFAALPADEFAGEDRQRGPGPRAGHRDGLGGQGRGVQVTGVAEVSSPADLASLRVSVTSAKESVNEVTNSVTRRLDYILQALRQHGVRDEDTSVRRFLHRDADLYTMDAEVAVTFSDFEKMEQICSILLEKLDKSVRVGVPRFRHSPECLSQTRQRACVSAVENAQQKAAEISQLLGQSLGSPQLVREEETKEWRNEEEEEQDGGREQSPAPHFPRIPKVTVSSHVFVSFSFRDKGRKKL
ncbi:interleukin-1 receptor-associated kinase 1-binding protein 1 homolog [Kryptolebias marmoratus]|uniref:Interleukin-1 receptor-associated kinase 1 binding protein 1 n=1 Tax=Kryptolebias marmoratus TaxID=37003 RepID=A0A3Q2ZWY3_KRYMA|nr:interleukin-1 receptor-associated kinase 1-binding protein 1 homolog [Kryptolebias marmoratus]